MRILVGLSDEVRVRNVNVESRNRLFGARFWQMCVLIEIEVVSRDDARGSRIPWAPGHVGDVPRLVLELADRADVDQVDHVEGERIGIEFDVVVPIDNPLDGRHAAGCAFAIPRDE